MSRFRSPFLCRVGFQEYEVGLMIDVQVLQKVEERIQVALQTGKPIIVWEEGRVKEIPADQGELAKSETEDEEAVV